MTGTADIFISLTYNPIDDPHAIRGTQTASQITFDTAGMYEHLPVSGDLKSGIPADVLTPGQSIH